MMCARPFSLLFLVHALCVIATSTSAQEAVKLECDGLLISIGLVEEKRQKVVSVVDVEFSHDRKLDAVSVSGLGGTMFFGSTLPEMGWKSNSTIDSDSWVLWNNTDKYSQGRISIDRISGRLDYRRVGPILEISETYTAQCQKLDIAKKKF